MANQFDTNRNCFTFTWLVENFEYCKQKSLYFLKSPSFVVDGLEDSKWNVYLYPRTQEEGISSKLVRAGNDNGPETIEVDFEIAFLTSDGSVFASQSVHKKAYNKGTSLCMPPFIERETVFRNKSKMLHKGALKIRCRMWLSDGEVESNSECKARTRIDVESKSFLWEIPNFSSFEVGQEATYGLKSTSDDEPVLSLKLRLPEKENSNGFQVTFHLSNQNIIFSTFQAFLVDAEGDYIHCGKSELWFTMAKTADCELPLVKDALVYNNELFLPNDVLTLYCEVAFSTGIKFEGIEDTVYGSPFVSAGYSTDSSLRVKGSLGKTKRDSEISDLKRYLDSVLQDDESESMTSDHFLSQYIDLKKSGNAVSETKKVEDVNDSCLESNDLKMDLFSFLRKNIDCDVKLCTESESFAAHWLILLSRSPVFRAMYRSDMKEKSKDQVDIKDLNPNTVRRMLLYMYTDSLVGLQWETASDLYSAADKYQIMSLKMNCSKFLKEHLNEANACELLLLANLFEDKELKSAVQKFILENSTTIINSSEWQLLMENNVQLAAETMMLKFK